MGRQSNLSVSSHQRSRPTHSQDSHQPGASNAQEESNSSRLGELKEKELKTQGGGGQRERRKRERNEPPHALELQFLSDLLENIRLPKLMPRQRKEPETQNRTIPMEKHLKAITKGSTFLKSVNLHTLTK